MRLRSTGVPVILAIALGCLLPCCTGGKHVFDTAKSGPATPQGMVPGFEAVPFPDDWEGSMHGAAALSTDTKLGKDEFRKADNASESGDHLELISPPGGLSWAVYCFTGLADADTPQEIAVEFAAPLPEAYYFGLADYQRQCWHWAERGSKAASTSETDTVVIPAGLDVVSARGRCYVAVLTWDGVPATIYSVSLTADVNGSAPVAAFIMDKPSGNAPLQVQFDASGSYDRDGGAIASYEWDWDSDGTFDESTAGTTASHIYSTVGEHRPVLRVTDVNDGLTDEDQRPVYVQGWVHTWGTEGTEEARVVTAHGGNVFCAGTIEPVASPANEILLTCFSVYGEPRWQRTFGGEDSEYPTGLAVNGAGRMLLVADTKSFGASQRAILLALFTQQGELLWQRLWQTAGIDYSTGVTVVADDNFLVCGHTDGLRGDDKEDALLLKVDPTGNFLWQKKRSGDESSRATDIEVSRTGDLYLLLQADYDVTHPAIGLSHLNTQGELQADQIYPTPSGVFPEDLALDWLGNAFVAGTTEQSPSRLLLARFSSSLDVEWVTEWHGADIECRGIGVTVQGPLLSPERRVYVGGKMFQSGLGYNALLLKYDQDGCLEWAKAWDGIGSVAFDGQCGGAEGAIFLGGNAVNAVLSRYDTSGSSASPPIIGIAGDGTISSVAGTISTPEGALNTLTGVLDTGGFGADLLVVGVMPDDL